MTKVYFAGSIRAGTNDLPVYSQFIDHMQGCGVEVLCEHFDAESSKDLTDKQIHDRDLTWIDESQAVVAEVTEPGSGYGLRYAIDGYKPALALLNTNSRRQLSAMIAGSNAEICKYKRTESGMILAKLAISEFLYKLAYPSDWRSIK